MAKRRDRQSDRAVYIISVAAELAGVHPQTLRIYERKGLLRPARTAGNTRRYSDEDITRLQEIQELTQHRGVNLAGVKMVLELQAELERLRSKMEEMSKRLDHQPVGEQGASPTDLLPLRSVRLPWEEGT
ncbi:MAG: heat shock protein transcriptional repressor HspR [Actinomycetota bacterium]